MRYILGKGRGQDRKTLGLKGCKNAPWILRLGLQQPLTGATEESGPKGNGSYSKFIISNWGRMKGGTSTPPQFWWSERTCLEIKMSNRLRYAGVSDNWSPGHSTHSWWLQSLKLTRCCCCCSCCCCCCCSSRSRVWRFSHGGRTERKENHWYWKSLILTITE